MLLVMARAIIVTERLSAGSSTASDRTVCRQPFAFLLILGLCEVLRCPYFELSTSQAASRCNAFPGCFGQGTTLLASALFFAK